MNYFKIVLSSDSEEIGIEYPQVQGIFPKQIANDLDSVYQISKEKKLPDEQIRMNYLLLKEKAILTDFLSSNILPSLYGFLVSERVTKILKRYNLPDHKILSSKVKHTSEELSNYNWIHILPLSNDYVNYEASVFRLVNEINFEKQSLEITSKKDYIECFKETNRPWAIIMDCPVFHKDFLERKIDVFRIPVAGTHWFFSERLINEMKSNDITGMKYVPVGLSPS